MACALRYAFLSLLLQSLMARR